MGINLTQEQKEQLSQQFADNLAKYPIEEQIATGLVSKNMLRGCSWEFVRNNPDIARNIEAFRNNPNVSAQEVTYSRSPVMTGYLVYIRLDYVLQVLTKEAPGLIEKQEVEYAVRHHRDAIVELQKLMSSGYRGSIGIYCTNDSQTITIRGKSFPAFAITLNELLQICARSNYGLEIGGAVRRPNEVQQRADAVIKASTVAPSSNALLFEIAPLGK